MQVFISWSGKKSNAVAIALRAWLPKVLARKVTPFVSSEDIQKGSRGLTRIAGELETAGFGVVVVTPSNQESTWVNFEAGALGKSLTDGRVVPLLVGLTTADLDGPLKQFQAVSATDSAAMLAFVRSVNEALPSDPLPVDAIETLFAANWPTLQQAIEDAESIEPDAPVKVRDTDDLLDEVVNTVRSLQRDISAIGSTVERQWNHARRSEIRGHALPFTGKARAEREALVERRVMDIIGDAGGSWWQSAQTDELFDVGVSEDTPTLTSEMLHRLQRVAREQAVNVRIRRPDGSSITFDIEGQESRVRATSATNPESADEHAHSVPEADAVTPDARGE